MDSALEPGDELHCPHCRRWHVVTLKHSTGTDETQRMLYFTCRALDYFAGTRGFASRHPTRAAERVAFRHSSPENLQ